MSDTKEWDEEKEDYANLADEMNDPDVGPWNEDDWDERAVANAKKYAKEHGLPWAAPHGRLRPFLRPREQPTGLPRLT
jgi:hypothetical protein